MFSCRINVSDDEASEQATLPGHTAPEMKAVKSCLVEEQVRVITGNLS